MPFLPLNNRLVAAAGAGILAAGLVAILGATANSAGAADGNLLGNAGFESGLTGWTCDGCTATAVSSPVHSGTSALAGTPTAGDTA
ncbi:MAG TPA: hypothetical protein VHZ97_02045, partial [Pseudonocardiaceae bacterium]|nr:hypothetical protein [Pseudonocardiaceae bacterium]